MRKQLCCRLCSLHRRPVHRQFFALSCIKKRLFDKGIDKILKKVGEEATELVIAAKNPNPEEVKYELSDFLYHAMVLMVERGVTWEDIIKELADR